MTDVTRELDKAGRKIPTPPFEAHYEQEPPEESPVLLLDGVRVASRENISTLLATPGAGKSQVCEAITAKAINPSIDGLGFTVNLKEGAFVLYVDTERSRRDFWVSWARALRRAQLPIPTEPEYIVWRNFVGFDSVDKRKDSLQSFLDEREVDLVIIDGIGDFILGVNDEARVIGLYDWLRALAQQYEFATLCTIHPNPNSEKARGHLGSELLRRSESVFTIKIENDVRNITTEFQYGKVRNDRGVVNSYFQWDDEAKMMVSVGAPSVAFGSGKTSAINWKQLFAQDITLTTGQIVTRAESFYSLKERTIKGRIKDACDDRELEIVSHGVYKIIS